ncbi:hypothetical protein HX037_10290, partial [Ignatzschineria indica]|uniref:hypothetical protein n=1 Tax=Ignatzschineria indica TaxID=472583 RepID=UPI002577DBE4
GDVNATSTDAVTGAQLFETEEKVKANTESIGDLNESLAGINVDNGEGGEKPAENLGEALATINNNVTNVMQGKAGLIQLAEGDEKLIIDNKLAAKATEFDFASAGGTRKLTGLTKGDVNATSTDAVTGAQLFETEEKVKANTESIGDLNESLAGINVDNGEGGEKPAENLGEALATINNNVTNVMQGKAGLIQLA